MAKRMDIKRSQAYEELSSEDRDYWFSYKEHKTLHHIDTLYYSIKILEERVFEGQMESPEMLRFLKALEDVKCTKQSDMQSDVSFHGFSVELKSFSLYSYCLSENELYDVFIAKTVPTEDTPRIVVQLRTLSLIQNGVMESIMESFERVRQMLSHFGIEVTELNENRIDYAWHMNSIQNVNVFMDDTYLKKHLKSNARNGMKHFNPQTYDYNYLAIGNRRSNNIFCRIYDKTREVIEEGYKGFFLDRWLDNGLINRYDYFCLQHAYKRKSYTVGLLVGRIEWYLAFGPSAETKEKLQKLKETCDIKSSNSKQIKKVLNEQGLVDEEELALDPDDVETCTVALKGTVPAVTTVLNVEYQTKRAFYNTLDQMINGISIKGIDPIYERISKVLTCEAAICDYLTSYGGTMSFVRDRSVRYTSEDLEDHPEEVYMDYWYRLRRTKIRKKGDPILFRTYAHQSDLKRMESQLLGKIASFGMLLRQNSKEDRTFAQDISDVLCILNDNDLQTASEKRQFVDARFQTFENKSYREIRQRKKRMMRNLCEVPEPAEGEENENPGEA